MVRRFGRLLVAAAGAVLTTALSLAAAAPASASPKPPVAVEISGDRMAEPLRLRADAHPVEVAAIIDQVNWLGRSVSVPAPDVDLRGPKFTLVVLAGDAAKQTYDLYPLAEGGPRIYRPADQPDKRKTSEAWFLGRLNMSETLRLAGVPLPRQFDTISGGVGGGERVAPERETTTGKDLDEVFGDLRQLLLLNVAVIVAITLGLGGITLLLRRRTR